MTTVADCQSEGSHFIAGQYVDGGAGAPFESRYPATNEVIAHLRFADADIVNRAVSTALSGFAVWSATPAAERGRVLRRAADIIRMRNRELAVFETLDTGKALSETLVADPASGADCLEYFGGIAASIGGEAVELGGSFAYTRREPLGVCAGIGAWNYPIQIACWKSAPALACGNAMVFKPSELTPLTTLKLAEIYQEAGLPDGVFNVFQGDGAVGAMLTAHRDVAKISFTGSVATGARVMTAAAPGIKNVTLELGGKSPIVIFDDADVDNAVSGAILGNFYSTGQICSNGTRVFVQRGLRQQFLDRLLERTAAIRLGDPMDENTHLGPLVNRAQYDKVLGYMKLGREEGATCAIGGGPAHLQGFEDGFFVEPTVFTDVRDDMRIASEEIFGPVMCVLDFDDEAEVIDRANDTEMGLAAGVFTRDIQRAHRVVAAIRAGTCWINSYNLTPIEMPFGGMKKSGIGRENARAAVEQYTQIKSVYVEAGNVDSPY